MNNKTIMVKSFQTRLSVALLLILSCFQTTAQVPGTIPYQAVARDASGNLLVNQVVGLRFSLCPDEPQPIIIHYQETHTVTTSDLGQINLSIGTGNVVIGSFNAIPWSDPGISLRVEMDPTGGTSYTVSGTTLLGSVPFALNAGSITGEGITTGTVSDSRLSTNVALYNRIGNFTALQNFEGSANVTGGMIIRKGPQTASFLTEWQDETGNTLGSMSEDGSFGSKGVFSKFSQITADLTSFSPFTITGAAGQYANLTEWKNASGTILASIGFNGVFSGSGAGLTDVTVAGEGITYGTISDNRLSPNVALYDNVGNFTTLQNFEGSANVSGGMIIRKSPQTASFLTEWQDETGNTLASLTGDGSFGSKGVFSKFSQINSELTPFSPFTVTGAAGQYANLTEWKNASGTILASINSNGVFSGNGSLLTNVTVAGEGITSGTIDDARLSTNVALYNRLGNFTALQNFEGSANVSGGMIIRKNPQTASFLTEWQDETGNTLASLTGDGSFGSKGVFSKFSQITADLTPFSPFTVTGATGQYANLTEWKNASGTILASINSNGVFSGNGSLLTNVTVAGSGITSGTIDDARLSTNVALYNRSGNFTKRQYFDGSADGTAGIVIRKGTGQIVALTDWQDETGNTIAYMQPNGSINTRGVFSKSAQINADLNAVSSPFTVTGATGQTVNLTEWKNPSGTVLASVSFSGVFSGNGSGLTNVVASGNTTINGDLTGTLSNAQIAANAVGSSEIINESITAGDLAANSVATSEILDGTIESADLANSAVTTAKLQDNSVTGAKISMGSDAVGDLLYYNGTDYARLPAGTAGQLLRMNGGVPTWSNPTGMIADMSSATGQATLPTSTLAFISPQITVTIANTSQKIMVDVNCPLGTGAAAASGLNLYPAYISTASGSSLLTGGAGIFSLTCPASSMQIYSVNYVFTGLSAGTYRFGMAGNTSNLNWTNRDYCYVRAVVVN